MIRRILARASVPVSGESGAVFRIAFGIFGMLIAVRYLAYGWVGQLLVEPSRHFTYPGFSWVHPWPEPFMSVHVAVMGIAALCVAFGWRYRFSLATFFGLFTYMELIDRTLYINHYYWIGLTALVMLALPLSRVWSLDARRTGAKGPVTMAVVWLLRFQVGFVYVFAGLAKLNADWLLRGEPLATWLGARTDFPLVGYFFSYPELAIALSWAGALFDLTIVGWMLWSRTRPFAYVAAVAFHFMTWLLFPSIGLFPLIMTVGLLVFFRPDWLSAFVARIRGRAHPTLSVPQSAIPNRWSMLATGAVVVYVLAMVLIPLRSVGDANVLRTGEGYQFGWRVMLTEKAGSVDFIVTDAASGTTWLVDGPMGLTARQEAMMATDPQLIRQAAAMVEKDLRVEGYGDLEIRAESYMSYNGRSHARFIDPTIDLTDPGETGSLVASSTSSK